MTTPEHEKQKLDAVNLYIYQPQLSYQQIADQLGLPKATAYRRVQEALDDMRPTADYNRLRAKQLLELAKLRSRYWPKFLHSETPIAEMCTIGDKLLKVQEREEKITGLDKAPTAIEEMEQLTDEEIEQVTGEWWLEQAKGLPEVERARLAAELAEGQSVDD